MLAFLISHLITIDQMLTHQQAAAIACRVALEGHLPIVPQIHLPVFNDEDTECGLMMRLRLVTLADEVRVYGEPSAGKIEEAKRLGIPVAKEERS